MPGSHEPCRTPPSSVSPLPQALKCSSVHEVGFHRHGTYALRTPPERPPDTLPVRPSGLKTPFKPLFDTTFRLPTATSKHSQALVLIYATRYALSDVHLISNRLDVDFAKPAVTLVPSGERQRRGALAPVPQIHCTGTSNLRLVSLDQLRIFAVANPASLMPISTDQIDAGIGLTLNGDSTAVRSPAAN